MSIFAVFLVVLVFILNRISTKYIFKGIRYKRNISKKLVMIDEEFNIETIVENDKRLPVTFLQVIERYPDTFQYKTKVNVETVPNYLIHTSTMFILPHRRVKRTYRVCCNHRGFYDFNNCDVSIKGGDLIGSNIYNKTVPFFNELVVIPSNTDIDGELIPYGSYIGNISVRRWIIEDPIMVIGIREYTGVEPQKNIHWNSTMKYGNLMVKEFDHTTDSKAIIIFNIECIRPFPVILDYKQKEKIEKCISIARTIAEEFEEKGTPYGFATNAVIKGREDETFIQPGAGQNHMYHIFENLGRIDYELRIRFDNFLQSISCELDKSTSLVVITPNIDENYIDNLNLISAKCSRAMVVSLDGENLDSLSKYSTVFVDGGVAVG